MESPEQPYQDTYAHGFDVIRMITNEFGTSSQFVRSQLNHKSTTIEIDNEPYSGDKLFIPVDQANGKFIAIIGPERQWRMRFRKPE